MRGVSVLGRGGEVFETDFNTPEGNGGDLLEVWAMMIVRIRGLIFRNNLF